MSAFTALNVEAEDTSEDEIDDTKEIQLEEAFKLYQNALRLQSLGPGASEDAKEAYRQLFQSEVFKYPEAISDYAHEQFDDDAHPSVSHEVPAVAVPSVAAESSANSLLQLIYLAYKNRGQFLLENHDSEDDRPLEPSTRPSSHRLATAKSVLLDFAEALARDDTDIDLWKKAARVTDLLSSYRIIRFCLESVLAGDDEDSGGAIDVSGLDEAFAAEQLTRLVESLRDDLSIAQLPAVHTRKALSRLLKQRNDPYPFLPERSEPFRYTDDSKRPINFIPAQHTMKPAKRTWTLFAQAILQALKGEQNGTMDFGPGGAVQVELPPSLDDLQKLTKTTEITTNEGAPVSGASADQLHADGVVESAQERMVTIAKDVAEETKSARDTPVPEAHDEETTTANQLSQSASVEQVENANSMSLPTRKRSSTAAGMEEPEARTKSKRLRARESLMDTTAVEEEIPSSVMPNYIYHLEDCANADKWLSDTVERLLSHIGVQCLSRVDRAKQIFDSLTNASSLETDQEPQRNPLEVLMSDFKVALLGWNEEKSQVMNAGQKTQDFGGGLAGLTLVLDHSKADAQRGIEKLAPESGAGLDILARSLNSQWSSIHDMASTFLETVLCRQGAQASSYLMHKWSHDFKEAVVQITVFDDERLYSTVSERLWRSQETCQKRKSRMLPDKLLEFVQSVFELHLDIYYSITNPNSAVDSPMREQQRDRLSRWADLAGLAFNSDNHDFHVDELNPLQLRYIFAFATFGNKMEESQNQHVQTCLGDLLNLLSNRTLSVIVLPNNVAMPEISAAAVEREISRLNTLDFFTQIFDSDSTDAMEVIEKLEPILQATISVTSTHLSAATGIEGADASKHTKLVSFLDSGDASLKLYLWKRLQSAYQSIPYTPMVISAQLRALETIVNELESRRHMDSADSHRQLSLLKWLREADEIIIKVLSTMLHEGDCFECIDEEQLKTSISVIARLAMLSHVFAVYDDSVKVGQTAVPNLKASATKALERCRDRFRDMHVRIWSLQYLLLKEATHQMPDCFTDAMDDLATYLRNVHSCLGIRQYCKCSNKMFIKLAKTELMNTNTDEDYSIDIAQLLFDLYNIKCGAGYGDLEHGCQPEVLDRKTALQLIPFVTKQANALNMKDLLKGELKNTIEKVQQSIGGSERLKSSTTILHNRKTISAYLKSPISANDLRQSVRGVGDLPTKLVRGDTKLNADYGWYFLLGHISLARFKSVKRVNPTSTDELEGAMQFLKQDLEHGSEKWESWYRLAQVYEAKIEEDLIWNSSKLNDNRSEIATLERNSIHAFTMAAATAGRLDDDSPEMVQKISEMYSDFGSRLYASTRPPLDMEAFKTDKSVRIFSREVDQAMYKAPALKPMESHEVWRFAAHLLRREFRPKEKPWVIHYTLGKCLWKLLQYELEKSKAEPSFKRKTSIDDVLSAFTLAIEALPVKSERSSDYILEPHFKLVSIVHKMVRRRLLSPREGAASLEATRYARTVHLSEDAEGEPEWDSYIISVLDKLSSADKQNWHHRIIARAAHVIFDDQPGIAAAFGAKHKFTQQIFTKTMTMQVWKPEFERPGRHYVYMGRYLTFFVQLLMSTSDRANMDQLLRRIRRKPADFLDHPKLWEKCVGTYVQMLREAGRILEGQANIVFHESLPHEEFERNCEMLEKWAHEPGREDSLLDVLRDSNELKKMNNTLMKPGIIDDLIMDAYAVMYKSFVDNLPPEQIEPPNNISTSQGPPGTPSHAFVTMATLEASAKASTPDNNGRMRVGNLITSQADGAIDSSPLPTPPKPMIGLGLQTNHTPSSATSNAVDVPNAATQLQPGNLNRPGGRTKNITKAALKRKIDALLIKPPPIKTPVLSKRPGNEFARTDTDTDTPSKDKRQADNEQDDNDNDADARDEDGDDEGGSIAESPASQRGSVHDSADAEESGDDNDNDEGEGEGEGEGEVDGDADSAMSDADENTLGQAEEEEGQGQATSDAKSERPRSMFPGLMATIGGLMGRKGGGAPGGERSTERVDEVPDSQDQQS